jgi:hypothetical protein
MAKKQTMPDAILKQFNKLQFKIGDVVFFTWLGSKKYGYVIKTKETNWGIQYMVESQNTRYPCGISIKGYKTTYTTGCIDIDKTKSIDKQELENRAKTGYTGSDSTFFEYTGGSTIQSTSQHTTSIDVSRKNNRKSKESKSQSTTKNVVKSSNVGLLTSTSKKRKNNELDEAIQRQRNFLNGFVK